MPLAFGLGRRRGREPRVRRPPPARQLDARARLTPGTGFLELLAEGGFVYRLVLFVAAFVALFVVQSAPAAASHRIVSLSPTATESLFAIGAGKQVVAVDDQSDYPKRAPRTSLSGYTPNVEAIAGYRPDLVVISRDTNDVVAGLRKLGIRVLLQPAAKDLAGAYTEIKQLGAVTGRRKNAAALVARMRKRIAKTIALVPKRRLSVYHELDPTYY